ncbi:MAG: SDR family oxidoreductase [Comamonas sp.]
MPVNRFPHRALPARFRRTRVLIIGCGDVGLRVARDMQLAGSASHARGPRVLALTSSPERLTSLRARGITPLLGDLDAPASLRRLRGVAQAVVYLAPPPSYGTQDTRMANALQALGRRRCPQTLVYGSTTGVYGDCGGAWVDETRATAAQTARAIRRVDAEQQVLAWGRQRQVRVNVLRIPGIYAPDREGGTPRGRLLKQLPVLRAQDDVYTNHIHADDLSRIAMAALWRGRPQRIYHASDDTQLRMGDYVDHAADLYGLPRPPRISRAEAQTQLPAMMLSFLQESRRLHNQRIKRELRVQLRYPTIEQGLRSHKTIEEA